MVERKKKEPVVVEILGDHMAASEDQHKEIRSLISNHFWAFFWICTVIIGLFILIMRNYSELNIRIDRDGAEIQRLSWLARESGNCVSWDVVKGLDKRISTMEGEAATLAVEIVHGEIIRSIFATDNKTHYLMKDKTLWWVDDHGQKMNQQKDFYGKPVLMSTEEFDKMYRVPEATSNWYIVPQNTNHFYNNNCVCPCTSIYYSCQ